MKRSFIAVLVTGIALQASAEPNATASAVPASLRACAEEKDDAQRLACFDREIARLGGSQTSDSAERAPAPAAAKLTPEERFGRQGGAVALEQSKREKATTPAIKELTATVVALSTRAYGEIVMTLDNGQVWSQTTYDQHFSCKVQDKVTIRAGVLGSFTLYAPSGRSTRVTRLR
jgi:hypothetical protein